MVVIHLNTEDFGEKLDIRFRVNGVAFSSVYCQKLLSQEAFFIWLPHLFASRLSLRRARCNIYERQPRQRTMDLFIKAVWMIQRLCGGATAFNRFSGLLCRGRELQPRTWAKHLPLQEIKENIFTKKLWSASLLYGTSSTADLPTIAYSSCLLS